MVLYSFTKQFLFRRKFSEGRGHLTGRHEVEDGEADHETRVASDLRYHAVKLQCIVETGNGQYFHVNLRKV